MALQNPQRCLRDRKLSLHCKVCGIAFQIKKKLNNQVGNKKSKHYNDREQQTKEYVNTIADFHSEMTTQDLEVCLVSVVDFKYLPMLDFLDLQPAMQTTAFLSLKMTAD